MGDEFSPEIDSLKHPEAVLLYFLHEVRNPALVITGYANVLLQHVDGPLTDHQQASVAAIDQCAQRILKLRQECVEALQVLRGGQASQESSESS